GRAGGHARGAAEEQCGTREDRDGEAENPARTLGHAPERTVGSWAPQQPSPAPRSGSRINREQGFCDRQKRAQYQASGGPLYSCRVLPPSTTSECPLTYEL